MSRRSVAARVALVCLVVPLAAWTVGPARVPDGPATAPPNWTSALLSFLDDSPADIPTGFEPAPAPASAPVPGADVAVVGTDAAVWLRGWDGAAWSAWQSLGGRAAGTPAVVSWGPGRLDVLAAGADAALWHRWWDGAWQPWERLGGRLAPGAGVAAATPGPGRLDVFVRGVDRGLWHRTLEGGRWSGWESPGCCLGADPAVASSAPGRLDVVVQRAGEGLWRLTVVGAGMGQWSRQPDRGGLREPSAVSWGDGRLDVFARDAGGLLWHWPGDAQGGWEWLGCCLASVPRAVAWGAGHLDLFGEGTDGQLWRRRFQGAWGDWERFDGRAASTPSATAWAAEANAIHTVPYRWQDYPLSCEAAALQMALAHEGIEVPQDRELEDIGIDDRPAEYDGDELRWGDPYASFVGDPQGEEDALTGYGTYWPTIARIAGAYGGEVLRAGEGISPQDVYLAVLQNHPVVAWVSVDWQYYPPGSMRTFGGREVQYQGPVEHAVTVVGVAGDMVYVFDPLGGPTWVGRDVFEAAYATYGHMAVILR